MAKERKSSLQISLPQSIKTKNAEGPLTLLPLSVSTSATTRSNSTLTIHCLNSSQKQKTRVADKRNRYHEGAAHKKATLMLQREQKKDNGASKKKGSEAITKIVNEQFGTTLNALTVRRYFNKGFAGDSPIKKVPEGNIPDNIFNLLTKALESYVRINQGNGNGDIIMRKNIAMNVNNVFLPLQRDGGIHCDV